MKDGTTHLAYKPEHAVDLDTVRGGGRRAYTPADARRHGPTLEKTLACGQGESRGGGRGTDGRRPGRMCATDKGYHSRSVLKALDDGPWKTRISEPKQKVLRAGTATGRPAGQSPTTGHEVAPAVIGRGQGSLQASSAPRSSSAPLRTTSIAAACAGQWLRLGRENVHKRYLLHVRQATICSLLMRKLIGMFRHPAGRPWRADMAVFACLSGPPAWSRSSRSDGPHRLGGSAKPPSSRYVSPSSETRSIAPFSTGC